MIGKADPLDYKNLMIPGKAIPKQLKLLDITGKIDMGILNIST